MAISAIWKVYAVQLVYSGPTTITIGALTNASMPVDASVVKSIPSGGVFPTTGYIDFKSGGLTFTTTMVDKVINELGIRGRCFPGTDTAVLYVYLAMYGCDGPLAGAVHRRFTLTKGIVYPTSMTVDHKGNLQISVTATAVYDGTTVPVLVVDNVALPTIADVNDQWTMSENCWVNDINYINKKNINVDFGNAISTDGADSDTYDSWASLDSAQPVVTVQGIDVTAFNTLSIGLAGSNVIHEVPASTNNTVFAFRKRFEDDVDAVHISMSINGLAYFPNLAEGNATDPAQTTVRIEGIQSSTGQDPLIFDTTRAMNSFQ